MVRRSKKFDQIETRWLVPLGTVPCLTDRTARCNRMGEEMPRWCVNIEAQSQSGDHEVHDLASTKGCLPSAANQKYLGVWDDLPRCGARGKEDVCRLERLLLLRQCVPHHVTETAASGLEMRPMVAKVAGLILALGLVVSGCGTDSKEGSSASPAVSAAPSTPSTPSTTYETARKREPIPFKSRVVESDDVKKGVTRVRQAGRDGVRVKIFRIAVRDGAEVKRKLVENRIVRRPVAQVTVRGTKVVTPPPPPPSNCDSNYAGTCVPIDSDVDCSGGSGDGPSYASGPVTVVGSDIYDLDRDGDGVGCD